MGDDGPLGSGCGSQRVPAEFETAQPLSFFPGTAVWIGGGGQLRLTDGFALPAGDIERARLYVTGLGAFYAFVNGMQVGDPIMDPPQTVYSKTDLYSTFDVSSLLVPGKVNHIGT